MMSSEMTSPMMINLLPDHRSYIEDAVAAGKFATPSEFVTKMIEDVLIAEEIDRIDALLEEAESENDEDAILLTPELMAEIQAEAAEIIANAKSRRQ